MSLTLGLRPEAVLLDHPGASLEDVLAAAADALAAQAGVDAAGVRTALAHFATSSQFALGSGVAVPHVAVPGLDRHAVALVRTAAPLPVGAVDGVPADLFFAVLFPAGDPSGHLQLLAHVAGLCRNRLVRDGLRTVSSAEAATDLITAAETRAVGRLEPAPPSATGRGLAIIAVSGERAADSILVELVGQRFGAASILEAVTVQDAASRDVPLFAEFRDLFGDPGARRMIFTFIDADRKDELAGIVERSCADAAGCSAELIVLPISERWHWDGDAPAAPPERE